MARWSTRRLARWDGWCGASLSLSSLDRGVIAATDSDTAVARGTDGSVGPSRIQLRYGGSRTRGLECAVLSGPPCPAAAMARAANKHLLF